MSPKKAIRLYFIVSILSSLLWILFPGPSFLFHVNSTILAFLFAIGFENGWVLWAILIWILLFTVLICTSFIFAEKRKLFLPFIITVGVDFLMSLSLVLCIPSCYPSWEIYIGLIIHGIHYLYTAFCIAK